MALRLAIGQTSDRTVVAVGGENLGEVGSFAAEIECGREST